MATLAVFLYPEKVGIARVKSAGTKPSYSSVQWRIIDNVSQLLEEPVLFASLIREMVGDADKYDIYLNVWPGAYNAVMFSFDKKGKGDLNRLRQAELETVFRGEINQMFTADLSLAKGKPAADGKSHSIIFTVLKERIVMMKESMKAQKMTLKRIAPMDVTAAETALKFWASKDEGIHVCMMLDEGCTSVSFLKGGLLYAMRTIPNGFGSVLTTYEKVAGLDHDACLEMIRANGVHVTEGFDMPAIQDDVLRMLNRITGETVKTLHNTFGDDAVISQVLLCGNFVRTVGLAEYLNSMLDIECIIAGTETLSDDAKGSIVLEDSDLEDLFPVALTTAKGFDLMYEMKKRRSDKIQGIILCTGLTLIMGALMAVTPAQISNLEKQKDYAANLLDQPEYSVVAELFNERDLLMRKKNVLAQAIENLPHGATNTAGMLTDIYLITDEYGVVMDIRTDYGGKTISVNFTTLNYDQFIYWQKEISETGRFSFLKPPTFNGNGLVYSVTAELTAADFDMSAEELAEAGFGIQEIIPVTEPPVEESGEESTEEANE